jgi:Trk-type K+ transport system membrane component
LIVEGDVVIMEEQKDSPEPEWKESSEREQKDSFKSILLFGMLLSGIITLAVFAIFVIAEIYLKDPLLIFEEDTHVPTWPTVKMACYIFFISAFFVYIPFKMRVHEVAISKKKGIILVTVLTFLLSSISLAYFLVYSTNMIDYGQLATQNPDLLAFKEKYEPNFDFKESFFDAISGFTTTGLTAFNGCVTVHNEKIYKTDVQPNIVHVIRAAYLLLGGLGIMFFYMYFTPVPSLMMSMGYEIQTERSLPRFVRLEGLSFSMVYVSVALIGVLLLYAFIFSEVQSGLGNDDYAETQIIEIENDIGNLETAVQNLMNSPSLEESEENDEISALIEKLIRIAEEVRLSGREGTAIEFAESARQFEEIAIEIRRNVEEKGLETEEFEASFEKFEKSFQEFSRIIEEIQKSSMTNSIILAFSSLSTGGFSAGSAPIDETKIAARYSKWNSIEEDSGCEHDNEALQSREEILSKKEDKRFHIEKYRAINKWSLLIITFLMLAGAIPLLSLHRPLKFLKNWKIFTIFLIPAFIVAIISFPGGTDVSIYRAFDVVSAFTTTGLFTSQFEKDFRICSSEHRSEFRGLAPVELFRYRIHDLYLIILMFIGGAAYSTAGGWGFFNFIGILFAIYLIANKRLEKSLTEYIVALLVSFFIFAGIFALGTLACYYSGLFNVISGEVAPFFDRMINSAFYEISALSTVGLMPNYTVNGSTIYSNNIAYITLALSMLVGRLFDIVYPFILLSFWYEGGT